MAAPSVHKGCVQQATLLKAAATSVYGRIFKIDLTKKVCRKLTGASAGTATCWE